GDRAAGTGTGSPRYPAAYPGVLGVGGVDRTGVRLPDAPAGSAVDIVAPGQDVLVAMPGHGRALLSGSDLATASVSAAAALLRASAPTMRADEVARRLIATADTVPDTVASPEQARGLVDPYRAVTEVQAEASARALPVLPAPTVDTAAHRRDAHWRAVTRRAVGGSLVVLALVAAAVLVAALARTVARRRADLTSPAAGAPGWPHDAPNAGRPSASGRPSDAGRSDLGRSDDDDQMDRYLTVPAPPRPR
ncbi:S8 family serine peptidase, partial [Frankia sp. AiPs1]|uniref:S8 family serine peptidase n=1 Tax=Frankia sp. AiPs1 TaxID=573493 RepID=UPI00204395B7